MSITFDKPGIAGNITKEKFIDQLIRVNQAGEYGAKRIYQGQLDVIKDEKLHKVVKHMAEQEEEHLEYFSNQLNERKIRPTALHPIWHVAGYALGAVTAKMGEKAAMACTVAVEEVIDEHYQEQLSILGDDEAYLKEKIEKFRQDELEHKQTGIDHNAKQLPCYELLSFSVKRASKLAIWLSKRI